MAGVKTLQAAIEAILFTMGESVELGKLRKQSNRMSRQPKNYFRI